MLCTPYLYLIFIKIIPSFILNSFIIRSILGLIIFTFWSYIMLWIVSSIEYSGVMILYNISGIILLTYFPVITFIIYHFRYLEKMIYPSNRCRHPQQQQQHYHNHHHQQHHHHHHYHHQQQQQHYNTSAGCAGNSNSNYQKTSSHSTFSRLIRFLKVLFSFTKQLIAIFTNWPCISSKNALFPLSYTSISSPLVSSGSHSRNSKSSLIQTAYYTTTNTTTTNATTSDINTVDEFILMKHHCLGVTPEQIRDEVEMNRCDFNARLLDILIGTGHVVYYACFLPIIFVQKEYLYVDYWWCLQHCFLIGLLVFLLRWHYFLPCDYIDLLHRSSMHLGSWENLLVRSGFSQISTWSASVVYPRGVVIKHMRGLFRSIGINNCAEPGNVLHSRFYYMFNNPQRISSIFVCLSSLIILYQCTVAYSMIEWYKLIGLVINGLFCFVNFYLHLRNSILVQFVYSKKAEYTSPTSSSSSSSLPTSTANTCPTTTCSAPGINQTVNNNNATANAFNVASVNSPSSSSSASSSTPHGNSPNHHTTHMSRNSISM
nr:unnamed protein product [Trichobilharzia regenti]